MADLLRSVAIPLATRLSTAEGDEGVNFFPATPIDYDIDLPEIDGNKGDSGGWLNWIKKTFPTFWEWTAKLFAWGTAFSPYGLITGGTAALFRLIADNIEPLYNFDWNVSDADLDQQLVNFQQVVFSQLGATLGGLAGFITCGGGAAAFNYGVGALLKFNDGAAVRILEEVGEEALDELRGALWALGNTVKNYAVRWVAIQLFKSFRRGVRALVQDPNSEYSRLLKKVFGADTVNTWRRWGERGLKPWSFARAKEEEYEKMKDKNWSNFWEEYDEEYREACREAFYVSANVLDTMAMARSVVLGRQEVIEVFPDREDKEEYYVVGGPSNLLESAITTTLRTHQTVENKDVGVLLGGEPVSNLITTPGLPYARILFSARPDRKYKTTYIDVHNLNKAKWDDWSQIKLACGGSNGYMWGAYRVSAVFPDNNQMICFAASEKEGEDLIESLMFLTLSGDEPEKINWTARHEIRKGSRQRYPSTYKTPRRQYPYEMTIVNPQKVLNEENGRANRSGIYENGTAVIPLYTDTKPDNFAETIADLFRVPGPND